MFEGETVAHRKIGENAAFTSIVSEKSPVLSFDSNFQRSQLPFILLH